MATTLKTAVAATTTSNGNGHLLLHIPKSAHTLAGFRAWVLEECPVAPGRRGRPAPPPTRSRPGRARKAVPRKATKTARFLDMATERHGSLASIPLDAVAAISADLAPLAGLHPGTARAALRKAVLAARNGAPR